MVKSKKNSINFEIQKYDATGAVTATVPVKEEVFGVKPNPKLIAHYIRVYLANQRQGNASTKTRGKIHGTTKKMYKQKGTGRARHSTDKANLFRGGGVTFGPLPKDVSLDMNKKQKTQALFTGLSMKFATQNIKALDTSDFDNLPKTKAVAKIIKMILSPKKNLIVFDKLTDSPFVLSIRNIKNISLAQASTLNAYQVLNHNEVLFIDNACEELQKHFIK